MCIRVVDLFTVHAVKNKTKLVSLFSSKHTSTECYFIGMVESRIGKVTEVYCMLSYNKDVTAGSGSHWLRSSGMLGLKSACLQLISSWS